MATPNFVGNHDARVEVRVPPPALLVNPAIRWRCVRRLVAGRQTRTAAGTTLPTTDTGPTLLASMHADDSVADGAKADLPRCRALRAFRSCRRTRGLPSPGALGDAPALRPRAGS